MKISYRLVVIVFAVIFIIGCTVGYGSESNAPVSSNPLIIAQGEGVSTLDAHQAIGTYTASVVFHIYDSLTRADATGEVKPLLAESYSLLDDTTWQFKLHKGVEFHNGEPFNAEVVKFNVERIQNPEFRSRLAGDFAIIERVDVVDDYTVNIITKEPYPSLPLRITYLGMIPPRYVNEVGDKTLMVQPIGTGPYKFVEWAHGERVVLEANEKYFLGAPEIKQVEFHIIPEDNTRLIALETGKVDIITSIPPSEVSRMKDKEGLKIVSAPVSRVIYIGLDTLKGGPLADKQVRQALNYAVDMQEIIDKILLGQGRRLATVFLPNWSGFASDIEPYPYDPKKAKELLTSAGYPDGFNVTLSVVPGKYPAIKEVAEAISGQLSKVGIQAEVKPLESALARELVIEHKMDPLYVLGLGGPYAEASQTVRIIICTGARYSNYSCPEIDNLIQEASTCMDVERATSIWRDVQLKIKEDAPVIFGYQQYNICGIGNRVKEWKPRFDQITLATEVTLK